MTLDCRPFGCPPNQGGHLHLRGTPDNVCCLAVPHEKTALKVACRDPAGHSYLPTDPPGEQLCGHPWAADGLCLEEFYLSLHELMEPFSL